MAEEPFYNEAVLAVLAFLRNDAGTALHHLGRLDQGPLIRIARACAQTSELALRLAVGLGGSNGLDKTA